LNKKDGSSFTFNHNTQQQHNFTQINFTKITQSLAKFSHSFLSRKLIRGKQTFSRLLLYMWFRLICTSHKYIFDDTLVYHFIYL